jgi:protein-tyrosine phosphatase
MLIVGSFILPQDTLSSVGSLSSHVLDFAEQCERDKARVLVHCMSGKNR